ncbi:C-type lectin domain family 2 member D-like isoform X3 [Gopherus evgoodei]|uniref:C-type lectin domain family 2 member D-like isoform X3 n=1 Tax=Gopherus evgoodei TaxID=1825980 RepID=UPI0011CF7EEF|nr:C-type lectin domain family 2 member D-like isoform X3 [Gopherus evgoodei]
MYMDPESQRVVAREIELLGVQHAPQGLQEKGEMEEHFHCSGDVKRGQALKQESSSRFGCVHVPRALCLCPGSDHTLRKCASRRVLVPAAVTVMLIIIIAVPAVLLIVEKFKAPLAAPDPPAVPCCPDGWIGYRGKCYYFSETDGNWTYSQSQCSALNASLAGIDSEQEKDFLLRYKGFLDRWIGLQRKLGQPWRWPNGTEFDNRFQIRGGGDCVFLIDEDWFGSSRCRTWRHWICSKPDTHTMGKGYAVESEP